MRLEMWSWRGIPATSVKLWDFSKCPAVSLHLAFLFPSLKATCTNSKEIRTLSHPLLQMHFHYLIRMNKMYHEFCTLSLCTLICYNIVPTWLAQLSLISVTAILKRGKTGNSNHCSFTWMKILFFLIVTFITPSQHCTTVIILKHNILQFLQMSVMAEVSGDGSCSCQITCSCLNISSHF